MKSFEIVSQIFHEIIVGIRTCYEERNILYILLTCVSLTMTISTMREMSGCAVFLLGAKEFISHLQAHIVGLLAPISFWFPLFLYTCRPLLTPISNWQSQKPQRHSEDSMIAGNWHWSQNVKNNSKNNVSRCKNKSLFSYIIEVIKQNLVLIVYFRRQKILLLYRGRVVETGIKL